MLIVRETNEKINILTIPIVMFTMIVFLLVLQVGLIIFIFNSLQELAFKEVFGLDLFNQILNIFVYIFPGFFAVLCWFFLPPVKTQIDRKTKIVSVKSLTPFSRAKVFGFDYIKNGLRSKVENYREMKFGEMFFELESGEEVIINKESVESRQKILETITKVNQFLQV